jgi:hypothetical protein
LADETESDFPARIVQTRTTRPPWESHSGFKCQVRSTRSLDSKEHQEIADKEDDSASSPWSKEDVKELKAHSKARTSVAKIAKAMKRTEGALRRKARILGIGLGHDR